MPEKQQHGWDGKKKRAVKNKSIAEISEKP
jgi:hypothetical protein